MGGGLMPQQLTTPVIKEWLSLVSGIFDVREIWSELDIKTAPGKSKLRVILFRFEQEGLLANLGSGRYRKVDNEKRKIDWQAADPENWLPIFLPFDIHDYARIYPKSIIIVAGSKNEGKTSFLLETLQLNVNGCLPIDLYNSETGPEQLKVRLDPMNFPNPAPFNVYERYDNFADIIEPEHLSIIDYLDFNSDVYLVGTEIDKIFRKLTKGVAIIGLQKPPPSKTIVKGVEKIIERDLAYGGGFTAKRAALYISLSARKCKLVYVKTPAKRNLKPDNKTWSYEFDQFGYFSNILDFYGRSD